MLYFYLSFSLEESRLSRFSSLYVSVFSLHISFSLPLFLWKILIKTFREQRAHIVRKRSPNKVFFGRRFLGQFIEVAAAQGDTLWDRQGWWSDEDGTQRWFSKLCYVRWTNPTFPGVVCTGRSSWIHREKSIIRPWHINRPYSARPPIGPLPSSEKKVYLYFNGYSRGKNLPAIAREKRSNIYLCYESLSDTYMYVLFTMNFSNQGDWNPVNIYRRLNCKDFSTKKKITILSFCRKEIFS